MASGGGGGGGGYNRDFVEQTDRERERQNNVPNHQ
jgi:hypothetical protein